MSDNIEIAAKYRRQLYMFLRDNHDGSNNPIPRDLEKDKVVINAYSEALKKLGITPDTEEVLEEVAHDNYATYLRLHNVKSLKTIFYKEYKNIIHVIENKYDYIGEETGEGLITGISEKCICVEKGGQKEFFWYLPAPLFFDNCNSRGIELVEYLLRNRK